jgi:hypothetical protein
MKKVKGEVGSLALVFLLLILVGLLPPDTSLSEVKKMGVLKVCVPTTYPPLITGDPDNPGIDVEILRVVADFINVKLLLIPIDAMGRDFNPKHWNITRGNCHVLAGGVVDSRLTRSFLDTGPPYAQTGWAIVAPAPLKDINGLKIGALTIISGLDRIGLARYLGLNDVNVGIVRSVKEMSDGIKNGEFDGGVTEMLLAGGIARDNVWWVSSLPDSLARYNLVFGLWKGDLTLKRTIYQVFRNLESDGKLQTILQQYGAEKLGLGSQIPTL